MKTCKMCGAEVTGRKVYCDKCAKYRKRKSVAFSAAKIRGSKLPEKYFYPSWAYDWFKQIEAINQQALAQGLTYGKYMAQLNHERRLAEE